MKMRVVRMLFVIVVVGASALLSASRAGAATPTTTYNPSFVPSPDPQAGGRWTERLATTTDVNGDGVKDFYDAAPMYDVNGTVDTGRVYLVSGKDRSIIRTIDSPEPQAKAKFGFFISVFGDVNGDGKPELAVGTDSQDVFTAKGGNMGACGTAEPNGCNEDQGKAWVFDGATGKLMYPLDNPDPQGNTGANARFGSRIGTAGDVTGDGIPDVLVGASNNDVCTTFACTTATPASTGCGEISPVPDGCRINQGQSYIFNGQTGAMVRRLDLPDANQPAGTCTSSCGSFGISVQSPGDTNGDGIPDQLVDAGSYSFYTGTGAACGAPEPNGCNEAQGREYVFSGATGKLLLRIDDPTPQAGSACGANFGFQDAAPNSPGDVNGDGSADIYANGFCQDGTAGASQGKGWVFSGKDGHLLYTLDDPTPSNGGQFGFSMARTDYNKDGTPDLFIGQSPHHVPGTDENGGTYIYDGKDGSLLKSLELPVADREPVTAPSGPRLGWTVAAPGDLNGDGEPDYIAGTPFYDPPPPSLSASANPDEGRLYVFLSSVPPPGTNPPPTNPPPTNPPPMNPPPTNPPPTNPPPTNPPPTNPPPKPKRAALKRGAISDRATARRLTSRGKLARGRPPIHRNTAYRISISGRFKDKPCSGRIRLRITVSGSKTVTATVGVTRGCALKKTFVYRVSARTRLPATMKITQTFLGNSRIRRGDHGKTLRPRLN